MLLIVQCLLMLFKCVHLSFLLNLKTAIPVLDLDLQRLYLVLAIQRVDISLLLLSFVFLQLYLLMDLFDGAYLALIQLFVSFFTLANDLDVELVHVFLLSEFGLFLFE